jgi:hypothetical protein
MRLTETDLYLHQYHTDIQKYKTTLLSECSAAHFILQCVFRPGLGWIRGGYQCVCRRGFFSLRQKSAFNGSLVEGKNILLNFSVISRVIQQYVPWSYKN